MSANPTRIVPIILGLLLVLVGVFAADEWLSELVWATYLVGCIAWELIGVFLERSHRQEPLTRIYRDRLMKMNRWGYLFRVVFLFLFAWWMVHWIVPGW